MKARTRAILAAGSDPSLDTTNNLCFAIHGHTECNGPRCRAMQWFSRWFAPAEFPDPERLSDYLTFIAMAAAVSETEP